MQWQCIFRFMKQNDWGSDIFKDILINIVPPLFCMFQTECAVQPSCYWLPAYRWAWPDLILSHCPVRWSTTSTKSTLPGRWVFICHVFSLSVGRSASLLFWTNLPFHLQAGHNFHNVDYSYVQRLCGTMLKGPKLPVMWVLMLLNIMSPEYIYTVYICTLNRCFMSYLYPWYHSALQGSVHWKHKAAQKFWQQRAVAQLSHYSRDQRPGLLWILLGERNTHCLIFSMEQTVKRILFILETIICLWDVEGSCQILLAQNHSCCF